MYITQTLKNMYKDHAPPCMEQSQCYDRYLSFKVYSEALSIDSLIQENNVISIIITKCASNQEKYFVSKRCKEGQKCVLHEIKFCDADGFNKCGVWYAPITIEGSPDNKSLDRGSINEMASDFAILCPCISSISGWIEILLYVIYKKMAI